MAFVITPEPYGTQHTHYLVHYGSVSGRHLVSIFSSREAAEKFVSYCEREDIKCRRQWVDKARHDVQRAYVYSNSAGGDLSYVPFSF